MLASAEGEHLDVFGPGADLELLAKSGWFPGTLAKAPLNICPDEGIYVMRPPAAALRDDPELWGVWDEWLLGYRLKPAPEEYRALSSWHLMVLCHLRMVRARQEAKVLRAGLPKPEEDGA